MQMQKKGQMTMDQGMTNVIIFAALIITLGIAATVVAGVQSGQSADGYAYNISTQGLEGLDNLSGLVDDMGTILGAVLILSLLVGGLYFFFKRG